MPKRKAAPGKVHLSECVMYVVLHSSHCVGHSIIDRPLDPLLWQVTVSRPQKKIVPPKAQLRAATFTAPLYEKHSDDKLVKEKVRPSVWCLRLFRILMLLLRARNSCRSGSSTP